MSDQSLILFKLIKYNIAFIIIENNIELPLNNSK